MGLLQSFLTDTKVSVHIKTQLSTISEQRVNSKLKKKNEKDKKKKMEVCVHVTEKEDDYEIDFSQNISWREHETQHESAIVLQ